MSDFKAAKDEDIRNHDIKPEESKFSDIKLEAIRLGRDYLLAITGGAAHIGAASTAFWAGDEIEVATSSVPGHKEDTISSGFAKRAAKRLKATVTLVMGIHYDNLSREGILQACSHAEELLEQYLDSQL